MMRLVYAAAATLFSFATALAHGQPCTVTISPGANFTTTVEAAAQGTGVVCLNPGTYTPGAGFPANQGFAIGKDVIVRGLGATPADVVLSAGAAASHAIFFTNYIGSNASGATLENLTISGGDGGIQILNFTSNPAGRLTDITLKDLVINSTAFGGDFFGVLIDSADRINIDNVTVTSGQTGFFLKDVTTSLIMNSTVTNTVHPSAVALAVFGGSGNVFVGNTFGSPKTTPTYPLPSVGVSLVNTVGNRFDDNVVQGFSTDGVNVTTLDMTGQLPAGQVTQRSSENYLGRNTVISTRLADGGAEGAGIWSNCGTHNTWLYANEARGVPECGICVYNANSNMVLGNKLHHNGITGLLASGGTETHPFCTVAGGAYRTKPTSTYVMSNSAYFNKADHFFFRTSDNTGISRNHASRRDGLGGALHPDCLTEGCQSAITFDVLGGGTNVGARIVGNISHDNGRGFWSDDGATSGIQFAWNKVIQPSPFLNRFVSGPTNWDGGSSNTGGNYWTAFGGASANPSSGTPFGTPGAGNPLLGVFHNLSNNTGNIVDRFPFRDEHMGRGWNVTVFEPRAGASLAAGTRRTVRWNAPGCSYVDITLDGTTSVATNLPNTGYAIVTVPHMLSTHTFVVLCKNSGGTVMGSGASAVFTVSDSTLQLKAPGRDDVFNAGQQVLVAWKKSPAIVNVSAELSTDGGVNWTPVGAGLTGTSARVTIPGSAASAYGVMRVRSGAAIDHTDGVFAIRGTGQGFANVPGGRKFVMGGLERLEWRSPPNSALVDITATVNGTPHGVAVNLPDRGHYDWVMPETGIGPVNLQISFKNAAGGAITSSNNNSGTSAFPNLITFAPVGILGVGASTNVTATSNSGQAVALSSLTPSVCTVVGTTVTGQSVGTCLIAGNQAGNANFAASAQVTTQITVASSVNPPRLGNISTRMQVLTGNDVAIGGFVIGGGANKTVAIVATGPSLAAFGIANPLANPTLRLVRSSDQATLATNDNWQTAANQAALVAAGFAPTNALESAILISLPPGAYTAIVEGAGGGTGVGVVAVYEVDGPGIPLINISTRGRVLTGNDVMIGGFVVSGTGSQTVAIVGTGPSLAAFGITSPLADPVIQLVRSSDQAVLATNDNWQNAPNAAAIQLSGFAPSHVLESAILVSLPPGAYTVIVSGLAGQTGVGVIGVYTTTATP